MGVARIWWNACWLWDPEPQYFLWSCPTCGGVWSGWLAGPKRSPFTHTWSLSGSRERPTLFPSLVCAMARPEVRGDRPACPGHFWLRDGQLVAA